MLTQLNFKSIIDLTEVFPTEQSIINYLEKHRWSNYYHSTLDFDLKKAGYPSKMMTKLFKEFANLLKYWQVSWDKTKKGGHIDLLTTEPLLNEPIYYQGWGKIWEIGEVKSLGGYVVDVDKDKEFVKNGKWYRKFGKDGHQQLKKELGFFFLDLGKVKEQKQSFPNFLKSNREPQQNCSAEYHSKILTLQAQIKQRFQLLINGKIYYRYNLEVSPHFFLFNTHNGSRDPPFRVGESCRFQLKIGDKYSFFIRLI